MRILLSPGIYISNSFYDIADLAISNKDFIKKFSQSYDVIVMDLDQLNDIGSYLAEKSYHETGRYTRRSRIIALHSKPKNYIDSYLFDTLIEKPITKALLTIKINKELRNVKRFYYKTNCRTYGRQGADRVVQHQNRNTEIL